MSAPSTGAGTGGRAIQGDLVNTGIITVNFPLSFSGAGTLTNSGSITTASGQSLNVVGATLTNASGGTIANSGTLAVDGGSNFNQGAGTTSGNPVQVAGTLNFTGSGTSSFLVPGGGNATVSGNMASGQSLTIQATDFCAGALNAIANAINFAGVWNITLTHAGGCNSGAAYLVIPTGITLSNSGSIVSAPSTGVGTGGRSIQGNLVNTGTIVVNFPLSFSGAGTLTNSGSITTASGQSLNVVSGATLTNASGGTIANSGTLAVDGGSNFNQGAGTTSGNPVQVAGTLNFTGSGTSSFLVPGGGNATVSGNMASGQSLTIQATDFCAGALNAIANAINFAGVWNITLTHAGGCNNGAAYLVIPTGITLSNSGSIVSAPSTGVGTGGRSIQGNLVNTGTIVVNFPLSFSGAGTLTNSGSITTASGQSLNVVGATLTNASGGTIANSGTLAVDGGSNFNQGAGTTSGNPVQVAGTLNFTGSGTSSFLVPGGGNATVSGNMASGQSLTIQATDFCAGALNAIANAINFAGVWNITLTHAGGCNNGAAYLVIPTGVTLSNSGSIVSAPSTGTGTGGRSIQGNLVNTGTITVNFPLSFSGAGTLTNSGSITTASGQSLNVVSGATLTNASGGTIANSGTVAVDSSSTFKQGAGSTYQVNIAGTVPGVGFGQLQVTGTQTLNGNLVLVDAAGFTPALGQTFQIITCATCVGNFLSVSGAAYGVAYNPTNVTITASLGLSTVVAAQSFVADDGTSTDAITVTLKDVNGNPVAGKNVSLAKVAGPGAPMISPSSGISNGAGQVIFAVSSSSSGADTFQATDTTDSITITQTAGVNFVGNPYSAVSTLQYHFANSDGTTWVTLDGTNLSLAFTPAVNSVAILSGNADLWTANGGFNQDIGIAVSGGTFPTVTGQPEAWKESGGFAGTFSPNAAFVQTTVPVNAATTYVAKLQWKANKAAAGATINVGAGPIGSNFSPTRLSVQLVPVSSASVAAKVSTLQYSLSNSDGQTWMDVDSTNLLTTIAPSVDSVAIVGANADLWTATAGFNQDLGITVSGGAFPTVPGQPEAWKESGGFAGTFSPNGAFVQTVMPMTHGVAYTIKLQWKANRNAAGATIYDGAGPIGGKFSPTSLSIQLLPAGANPYRAVSALQYKLQNSDGTTWRDIDLANLSLSFTPTSSCLAILSGNADLWTANGGFNQDLGITLSGRAFPTVTGQPEAWKESGGFAGTFSPNAAFVQTVVPVNAGTYTVRLQWKTNKNAAGVTVYAGAGPIGTKFSPTILVVQLVGC